MTRVFKAARLTVVVLALAAGSTGTAIAQQGGTVGSEGTGSGAAGRTGQDVRADRGFDYGWLGLIGLAGLIPLFLRRNGNGHHTHSATDRGTVR